MTSCLADYCVKKSKPEGICLKNLSNPDKTAYDDLAHAKFSSVSKYNKSIFDYSMRILLLFCCEYSLMSILIKE